MTGAIAPKATGVVYRNPNPHLRSIVAYHPSLTVLRENDLLATFDLGETVVARSTDLCETWAVEGPVIKAPPPSTTHTSRTSQLRNGSLVGFGGLHHRHNIEEGLVNRENFGFVPVDLFTVSSSDGGKSW